MTGRFSRAIEITAMALALFAFAPATHADVFRTRASDNWNSYLSWERLDDGQEPAVWVALGQNDPVPASGDTVTIRSDHTTVVTDTRAVTTATVEGELDVDDNGTLTLNGTDPSLTIAHLGRVILLPGSKMVAGPRSEGPTIIQQGTSLLHVQFSDSPAATPVLELAGADMSINIGSGVVMGGIIRVTADSSFYLGGANGSIAGDTGTLEIGPSSGTGSATLTSFVTISGIFRVTSNSLNGSAHQANFDNRGRVVANDPFGLVHFTSSLNSIVDTAGGNCQTSARWGALGGAVLRFDKSATGLHGDFSIFDGELEANASVATDGLFLIYPGGLVDVNNSASFNVTGTGGTGSGNHYCSGSYCTSASFPYTSDVTCP